MEGIFRDGSNPPIHSDTVSAVLFCAFKHWIKKLFLLGKDSESGASSQSPLLTGMLNESKLFLIRTERSIMPSEVMTLIELVNNFGA